LLAHSLPRSRRCADPEPRAWPDAPGCAQSPLRRFGGRVLLAERWQDRGPLALRFVLVGRGVLALLGRGGDRALELAAAAERVDVGAVERLVLEERLGDLLELLAVLGQDLHRAGVLLGHDAPDVGVDPLGGVLAVALAGGEVAAQEDLLLAGGEVEWAEL